MGVSFLAIPLVGTTQQFTASLGESHDRLGGNDHDVTQMLSERLAAIGSGIQDHTPNGITDTTKRHFA